MIIKTSLLDMNQLEKLNVGSPKWKKNKYNELIKLPFEELEKMFSEKLENKNLTDYWTINVIIDIYHSYYFNEFKKKYPRAELYKREINYLNNKDEF